MDDFDRGMWIESAQSYVRLRRRYWWFCLGDVVALVLATAVSASLDDHRALLNPIESSILASTRILFVCALIVCVAATIVTNVALELFRCPRCGGFFVAWREKWPGDRCKHCALDLLTANAADAKLPAADDLLE